MNHSLRTSYLVGLIGRSIQASRSPALHEREADEQGLHLLYRLIDFDALRLEDDALPALLTSAEQMGFDGLNVTYPFKQMVIPLLDDLSDAARAVGAVNTIRLMKGRRIGHNTDVSGFAESFRRGLADVSTDHVVQIGAGGAGAATAYAMLKLGTRNLSIFDIVSERAAALADQLSRICEGSQVKAVRDLADEMETAQGLVHATPMGMEKHAGMPLPTGLLRRELWIAEIVYFPLETELLRVARALARIIHAGPDFGMADVA